MPKKNIIKEYSADTYYHVYSRGINKNKVFLDENDKIVFLSLLKRYLSETQTKSKTRHKYISFYDKLDLITYALMSNHFHLLIYQKDDEHAIISFMRSLMISYGMYFNKKYQRHGPVFQSAYLATRIDSDAYLEHVSRYIHLNPSNWETTKDSSIDFYRGNRNADWIKPLPILEMFPSFDSYLEFLKDYDSMQEKNLFDLEPED
jgi:REP element-mobilizing transposase RayT